MADHSEYEIRQKKLTTDPLFKNFKEGLWRSPKGTSALVVRASYEASAIILHKPGEAWTTSISPICWDLLFSEWVYDETVSRRVHWTF